MFLAGNSSKYYIYYFLYGSCGDLQILFCDASFKEEENAKVEYGRKSVLLQKLEEEHDWTKAEKTRSAFESLQSYILSLQESIGRSSSSILTFINKELHPQLITLTSG